LISILGTSFVGPIAARLAFMLVACASLALQTPGPASRDLDVSNGPRVVDWQPSTNSTRDHEWRNDAAASASDACDDDDDDGDDESSAASCLETAARAHVAPDFSDSTDVGGVTGARHGSRGRDVYLLRGPPAVPMESTIPISHAAGTYPAPDPCVPLLRDQFHSASAQSEYGLRAPP